MFSSVRALRALTILNGSDGSHLGPPSRWAMRPRSLISAQPRAVSPYLTYDLDVSVSSPVFWIALRSVLYPALSSASHPSAHDWTHWMDPCPASPPHSVEGCQQTSVTPPGLSTMFGSCRMVPVIEGMANAGVTLPPHSPTPGEQPALSAS